MPTETPTYDLMLLLSMGVEDERRAKILKDVETSIDGEGSIVHNADWGRRPLAYRIDHQAEAEYHLIQFNGPPSLLESLGHNLGITDGVLRHRIIKILPGTPPAPSPDRVTMPAAPPAPASAEAAPAPAAEPPAAEPAEPTPATEPAEPGPAAEAAPAEVEPAAAEATDDDATAAPDTEAAE